MFATFQLGLFNIRSIVIEARPSVGGQLSAFYADKPIYDAPGFTSILAGEFVDRLGEQVASANPVIISGCRVVAIENSKTDELMSAHLADGRTLYARAVILATGGGAVETVPVLFGQQVAELMEIDPSTFCLSKASIFTIGDAAVYPGKLRLILSAFHEAALMTQAVRKLLAKSGDGQVHSRRGARRMRKNPANG